MVLKSGRLGDALRATHTVPFFYEPIRIDGKYLFDGGLYNNFPVDVMQREFAPEIIIGANVSSKVFEEYPFDEDEALISKSLLYMLLDKSDPGTIPASGVYIQPNLQRFSGIDFSKVREMIDSGYAQTMRQMPEIKSKVLIRRNPDEVELGRQKFLSKSEPFMVDEVRFNGFNKRQQRYLSHFFSPRKGLMPMTKIKSGYYNLMSEEYFKNVYPSFSKGPADSYFKLDLTRRPQKNLQVDFGGIISNRNISSMFLGANYYYFNRVLTHSAFNFNVGNFNKSAQVKIRMDFSRFGRFYLAPEGIYNEWNFLANRDLVTAKTDPTILQRYDRKVGLHVGLPVSRQIKFSLNGFYINNSDFFSNNSVLISSDTLDRLKLSGWRTGFLLETNNLNRKQYASAGKSVFLKLDWLSLAEKYTPGNTSALDLPSRTHHAWVRLKISAEQYWKTKSYSTGYFVEGVFSNQPVFSNFTGTIVNAPGFYPMQDSRTLLLKNFRAFNYLAGGIRNIFSVRPNLDFRLEGYLFKPFEAILLGSNQETRLSRDLTRLSISGMAALVLHSTVGPVSLSVNYYDDKSRTFGVLLHIGYLLFQKTSTE